MAAPLTRSLANPGLVPLAQSVGRCLQLPSCGLHTTPTIGKYADWKMVKEVRNRKVVKEFAFERLNINALRKNKIIPEQIKEIADKEIAALPTNSSITRLHKRCALTSRPRGLVTRWRLSRIVWRHEADYNKLSGVQRAMW
ncbi:28S ribosomal protein S14, mitochondrial-like [Penaeus japonicus]|uniref:28S ribosomal protein S14, mitochondrial-like n=1 Tax=Penaeus japonicus TaxID=27405 RepID=UPI001C711450|nr:28S ribosomal protein S14, mitochondrial-like [Penaeus japonicus]